MSYNYEKRITVLLSKIVECCGEIQYNESVCDECKIRIAKCSRLVKRSQISILYYVELVRSVMVESRK